MLLKFTRGVYTSVRRTPMYIVYDEFLHQGLRTVDPYACVVIGTLVLPRTS